MRVKKALKERAKGNPNSHKNILNNKISTSRALIKTPFDMSSKSILKRKSRKALKKTSEKQSLANLTHGYGKENRHPNILARDAEKRSSVPRKEKSKLISKKQMMNFKRTGRKKTSKRKSTRNFTGDLKDSEADIEIR